MNITIKHQKVDNLWKEIWRQTSGNKIDDIDFVKYNDYLKKNNFFISFPRSGHHAMVTALLYYFNLNGLNYCESYNCCNSFPCSNNRKFENKSYYLIGIRHPVDSIVSWYYLNCRANNVIPNEKEFKMFFKEKLSFYISFIDKWLSPKYENVYVYEYNNFLNSPYKELNKIIDFFSLKNNIRLKFYKFKNILKLRLIIKNIQKRPDLSQNYNTFDIDNDEELVSLIKFCEKKLFEVLGYEVKSDFWIK
jgi:hypothetical protein